MRHLILRKFLSNFGWVWYFPNLLFLFFNAAKICTISARFTSLLRKSGKVFDARRKMVLNLCITVSRHRPYFWIRFVLEFCVFDWYRANLWKSFYAKIQPCQIFVHFSCFFFQKISTACQNQLFLRSISMFLHLQTTIAIWHMTWLNHELCFKTRYFCLLS